MLEAPGPEPSSGSTELFVAAGSLDDRVSAAMDQEEKVKEYVEECSKANLIRWIYGSCDTLICNVKKKMPKEQRILYILNKNPKPSPIEFAKLFMEINDMEQCCTSGKAAFDACKDTHVKYDNNFDFNALSKTEQNEYKQICYSSSECAVCGRPVVNDKVHCSKKCELQACVRCDGPTERFEEERRIHNVERDKELSKLEHIESHGRL
jgi:hypothetical protein